jgi:penicillin-binding protein 1A
LSNSETEENQALTPGKSNTGQKKQLLRQIKSRTTQIFAKVPSDTLYRRRSFWLGLGVSGGMIAFVGVWWSIERSLPETAELYTFVRDETMTIKAADEYYPSAARASYAPASDA